MHKLKHFLKARRSAHMKKNEIEAQRTLLEELFNDLYKHRVRIYKVNFVRGILFGAGSAVGGTIVLALIVWLLSLFVNFPVIGNVFENAQQSIERSDSEASKE